MQRQQRHDEVAVRLGCLPAHSRTQSRRMTIAVGRTHTALWRLTRPDKLSR